MEMIVNSLIKIAALLLLLLGSHVCKRAGNWLKANLNEKQEAALDNLIGTLTAAAEQMFRASDENGAQRLNYVKKMLVVQGYELTDAVRAKIESKVFQINQQGS